MKIKNLLLIVLISAVLSSCGGAGVSVLSGIANSAMSLPNAIAITGAAGGSSNLAAINYALFSDAGTDYTKQSQDVWYSEDEYPQLEIINGVLKIMSFTNATDMVNKGNYKILYDDPFDNGNEKLEAYVEVTRADDESPMYVKFLEVDDNEGNNLDPQVRIVHVKINKGASEDSPLGNFEMTMVELEDDDTDYSSVASWLAVGESDGVYDKMVLKISADDSVSGQTNIQFEIEQDGQNFETVQNVAYDKRLLSANLITQGSLDSGYGWLLKEMAVGNNDYTYEDTLYPAFDDKYIADRVGPTTETGEGGTGTGILSYRTQHDETHHKYKLFNTDGSNLDLGSMVPSFGFEKDDEYGYVWSNYDGTTYGSSNEYSGEFYFNGTLSVGDEIEDFSDNAYTVAAVDTTNGLVDLTKSNVDITVAGWELATIGSGTFHKSADDLYPSWGLDGPHQLIDGDMEDVNGTNYIVKPTMMIRQRQLIGEDNTSYTGLDQLTAVINAGDEAQVDALLDTISNLDNLPDESGLTFDASVLDSTYTWYKSIKDDLDNVELRVIEGETIEE